jgi:hypothetical protein
MRKGLTTERLQKSFKEFDMLKGVYTDTAENRKKGRVGQKFGSKKEDDEHAGTPHAHAHIKTSSTKDLKERHKRHSEETETLTRMGSHDAAKKSSDIASRYGDELIKRGKGPKTK